MPGRQTPVRNSGSTERSEFRAYLVSNCLSSSVEQTCRSEIPQWAKFAAPTSRQSLMAEWYFFGSLILNEVGHLHGQV
jgi:hypothetical protein